MTVVDEQPLPAEARETAQLISRGVGAFEVMRPMLRPGRDRGMQLPDSSFLHRRQLARDNDQEVTVAVEVGVTQRERALEVGTDEVVPKN